MSATIEKKTRLGVRKLPIIHPDVFVGLPQSQLKKYLTCSPATIIRIVSDYTNITPEDLRSKVRERNIVEARQLAMFFIYKNTPLTLKRIGMEFNRDHSTVIHSKETVEDLYDTDKVFRKKVDDISDLINND